MKRKLITVAICIIFSVGVCACGQKSTSSQPGSVEDESSVALTAKSDQAVSRDGFSIQEISDELFERMKSGNTYKDDCVVPREDLRYLLVLHKDTK